jgi:hypothetical protein
MNQYTLPTLFQDNLQSTATQKAYASAVSGGQKWVKEKVEEYTTGKGDLRACLVPIFCHTLAPVSFDKPTEVTVPVTEMGPIWPIPVHYRCRESGRHGKLTHCILQKLAQVLEQVLTQSYSMVGFCC